MRFATTLPLVSIVTLLMLPMQTTVAAECKGMQKSKCEKANHCTYVKGYTTKSGTKVAPYCRNKSKQSTKSSAKTSSKTTQSSEKYR